MENKQNKIFLKFHCMEIKAKLLGNNEIHRSMVRLTHEIIEKNSNLEIGGCTDDDYNNFNKLATFNDGTCTNSNCWDDLNSLNLKEEKKYPLLKRFESWRSDD